MADKTRQIADRPAQGIRLLAVAAAALIATSAVAQDRPTPWQPAEEAFPDGWVFTPSFSPDGETAWIVNWADPLNLSEPQALYTLSRRGSGWGDPQQVNIAPGQLLDWPSVSPDGNILFLSIATTETIDGQRIDDFDLYTVPLPWDGSDPVPIDDPGINTVKTPDIATLGYAANETGPRLLADGTLVFWTQREGAAGWRDIFFAAPREGGGWEPPVQFEHNTAQRDSHPYLPADGSYMLFASNRPGGYGQDDLYYTAREDDGGWSEPCNLGPRINGPYSDGTAAIDPVTGNLLFGSNRPLGGETLYRVFEVVVDDGFCE